MDMDRKEGESKRLSPTLSGNIKGEPLFNYFRDRLPPGLRPEVYEHGLGCDGFARLISSELGGPKKARIYSIERVEPGDRPQDAVKHTYVIPENASPRDLAFNNWGPDLKTVEQVLKQGTDVTDEIFSTPWDRL